MARKKPRKKRAPTLSEYQILYAKFLYGRGMTQDQLARLLDVHKTTISRHKLDDGTWEDFRSPPMTFRELIDFVKDYVGRRILKLLNGDLEDIPDAIKNIRLLTITMKDLQEMVHTIGIRDKMLALEAHMEWLHAQTQEFDGPGHAAQVHYDELKEELE